MKILINTAFFLLAISLNVNADSFSVEDKKLLPIPSKVAELIVSAEQGEWGGCKFKGNYYDLSDLSGDGIKNDLIVTVIPSAACGIGNAKGPIWILRGKKDKFNILLSTSGYNIVIDNSKKNGLYTLNVTAGTAGWNEESHWEFDGKKYVEVDKNKSSNRNK